jgi:hypothetical protein
MCENGFAFSNRRNLEGPAAAPHLLRLVTHFGGEVADLIRAQREGGAFPHMSGIAKKALKAQLDGRATNNDEAALPPTQVRC